MKNSLPRLVLAVGLTLAVCAPAQPQAEPAFSMTAGKTTSTLPFEMIDNRVFVEMRLNGRGPFHFILDTGDGGFTIGRDVADRLGLHVTEGAEEQGVGAKSLRG